MSRRALIVATYEYSDARIAELRAARHDAEELAQVLADPNIGGFEVEKLVNRPWYEVQQGIGRFLRSGKHDDFLILHFSCHGLKDDSGELYFAASDTSLDEVEDTTVASSVIHRALGRSRAGTIVLFLDCCYSGAFENASGARAADKSVHVEETLVEGSGRGRIVITASTALEFSFERGVRVDEAEDTDKPAIFSGAIIEGLRTGDADADADGLVSLDELYDYVSDQVRRKTPHQTPTKSMRVEGNPWIARAPVDLDRVSPAVRALASSDAEDDKFEAIEQLRRLLESGDTATSRAARSVLSTLATGASSTSAVRRAVRRAQGQGGVLEPGRGDTAPPTPLSLPALQLFRWLRLAAAFLTAIMLVSVVLALVESNGCLQTSISAYYYTSAKQLYVGTTLGTGICLLFMPGSNQWETVLLRLAGVATVVVALVPTSHVNNCSVIGTGLAPQSDTGLTSRSDIAGLEADVVNTVTVLLVVGLMVALTSLAAIAAQWHQRRNRRGLAITCGWLAVLLVVGALFRTERGAFLEGAHFWAQVIAVLAIIAVVLLNARETRRRNDVYRASAYATVAALMIGAVISAPFANQWLEGPGLVLSELAFLSAFVSFWIVQAFELWDQGTRVQGIRES